MTWQDLQTLVSEHRILPPDDKLKAPALCPAEWPEHARTRKKETVSRVWFGALDYDKLTNGEMERVLDAIGGLACTLYTTWSHPERLRTEGTWSFRLLVALSRPVEADEWKRFWPRFHARLGALGDLRCKDPSRIYFMPSAPSPEGCEVAHSDGVPLNVDELLALAEPDLQPDAGLSTIGKADLANLADRLVRRRNPNVRMVGHAIREALQGRPLADVGNRDNTLFTLACCLAEQWPDANPGMLANHFAAGLAAMARISPTRTCPTLEHLTEKIERKQVETRQARKEREKEQRDVHKARIRRAFDGERDYPYTEDELNSFAARAKVSRRDFNQQWIVQSGKSFYLFRDGSYGPAIASEELLSTAVFDLAPASSAGVDVWKLNKDGVPKQKTAQELMVEYGVPAATVVADLNAQHSHYDAMTRTITEAPCPVRPLEPAEPEDVLRYLEVLGGQEIDRLLDWLTAVTRLDRPCAALYFDGEPGAGKTLLAEGLARLWTKGGPTALQSVVGDWNEELLRCPLVFADEKIPEQWKRFEGTGALRQMIQARQTPLRRKYRPTGTLLGSLRFILAANNRYMLETNETLTKQDVAAIAERILYLQASHKAKTLLENMGTHRVAPFVENDLLARYALWLRENRKLPDDHRFIVSGSDSALHQTMTTGRGLASAICHWCVSYLLAPAKLDVTKQLLVRVHKRQLFVTARALSEKWDVYPTNTKAPTAGHIGRVLHQICGEKTAMRAGDGKVTRYWPVLTDALLTWAKEVGYASREELHNALGKDTK